MKSRVYARQGALLMSVTLLSGIAGGLDSGARNIVTIFNNIICDIALLAEEVAKKNEGAA